MNGKTRQTHRRKVNKLWRDLERTNRVIAKRRQEQVNSILTIIGFVIFAATVFLLVVHPELIP